MKNTDRLDIFDATKTPNIGGWRYRHLDALTEPKGPEREILGLLYNWLSYADQYKGMYGDDDYSIGTDYVLGPDWAAIGVAVRGLLNGETGRLDCGTLDGAILETLEAEGFNGEGEQE